MEIKKPEFSYNTSEQYKNTFAHIQALYFEFVEKEESIISLNTQNLSDDQKRELINSAWNMHFFTQLQCQIDAILKYFEDQSEINKKR